MIKLVDVNKDYRFGPDTHIKPATLKSPRQNGFEFAIVNEYIAEDPIKLTKEQTEAMFRAGMPTELLLLDPQVAQLKFELQEALKCKRACEAGECKFAKAPVKKPAAKKATK